MKEIFYLYNVFQPVVNIEALPFMLVTCVGIGWILRDIFGNNDHV